MHRPLGRAALMVYAPFSLAVARLRCPARLALAHLPAWVGRRAGLVACPSNAIPAGLPLRGNCQKDWLARASALRASAPCAASPFGSSALRLRSNWRARTSATLRVSSVACARQFGYAFGQTPAHLVCSGCSPIPPETRKVVSYAP